MDVINGLTAFFVMDEEKLIATLHNDQFESDAEAEKMANFISMRGEIVVALQDNCEADLLQKIETLTPLN